MRALVMGTGLIGASVGAGLRRVGWEILGWDPSPDALRLAHDIGALDEIVAEPVAIMDKCDLVVLAGPVGAILDSLPDLTTDTLVTDVAGVKTAVVAAASHLPHFVGGHPMAGRESSGPAAASGGMFQGASWILTTDGTDESDLKRLREVVESLGAVPVVMEAAVHDAAVAAVSHVPQVVAAALVNIVAADEGALALAAGGFRDLTRIALSEPRWWTDILIGNSASVSRLVRELGDELRNWADRLESGDREEVAGGLEAARAARQAMAAPVAAVGVLLDDRPGEIARVGHALAASGVDVRDLQLRHATRGGGGVLTLSVLPGQEADLAAALRADGFRLL